MQIISHLYYYYTVDAKICQWIKFDKQDKLLDIHEKGIVSIDGKESRGSKRKTGAQGEVRALQTLNVYSNDYGICLAQKFIEEKRNEISAAQEILHLMDLKDMIVTADAMNCQKN